jgi:hypothetical protein
VRIRRQAPGNFAIQRDLAAAGDREKARPAGSTGEACLLFEIVQVQLQVCLYFVARRIKRTLDLFGEPLDRSQAHHDD